MKDFPDTYLEAVIDGEVRLFPLEGDRILRIGRSDTNDVVLNDDRVSRNHAMLQGSEEGLFYITDCGSRNGTMVNELRATAPVILRPRDQIRIGSHDFTFHQVSAVEPPDAKARQRDPSTNVMFAWSLVTVLVVDIRDFTGLAQRVEGSKLTRVTGTLFKLAGRELQERGAWAQKYIGDAVMAVWRHSKRAPEPHELASIFEGLARLFEIASGLQKEFDLDEPIRVGAGMNSGAALIGNVGSVASSDYTALGDVVNKVFRLESATKEMGCDIALGQETYGFLSGSIDAEQIFRKYVVKLKGYEEPSPAFGAPVSSLVALIDALRCPDPSSAAPRPK